MKKYLFFAAALLGLVACQNNDPENVAPRKVTLHATVENGGAANGPHRIAPIDPAASTVSFAWQEGDQVTIKTNAGSYTLDATNIEGNLADFEGEVAGSLDSYTVYYGYDPDAAAHSIQYVAGSFKPCVYGTGAGESFTLDQFFPVLKLQLLGENYSPLNRIEYLIDNEVKAVMTFTTPLPLSITASVVYMPVPAVDAAGFTLKFYDIKNKLVLEKATTFDLSDKMGKIVTMPELYFDAVWTNDLTLGKRNASAIVIETGVDISSYTEDANHKKLNASGSLWEYLDGNTLRIQTWLHGIDASHKSSGHFMGYNSVQSITGLKYLHWLTNMVQMFYNCKALTTLDDISELNTEDVRDMSRMFDGCRKLNNVDLTNFNTTKVTSMDAMFRYCDKLTSVDLSSFKTANTTNISTIFHICGLINITLSNNFVIPDIPELHKDIFTSGQNVTIYGVTDEDLKNALRDCGTQSGATVTFAN